MNGTANGIANVHGNENRLIPEKDSRYRSGYTKKDYFIIFLTVAITLFGFIFRTWRLFREGMPVAYDGYFYLRYLKPDFFHGWKDLSSLSRDPPGFTFILIMAEFLLGLPGQPIIWSIYIFPQIIASIQLIIYFIMARRLTRSRSIGLITMLIMSFIGLIVNRNQNVAPEIIVLGLVPFVVFFIARYLETEDYRFLIVAILISVGITLIHHLTTLIMLACWHVLLPYDLLMKKIYRQNVTRKNILTSIFSLIGLNIFVLLIWGFFLHGFPLSFISQSLQSGLCLPGTTPDPSCEINFYILFGSILLNALFLFFLFYNFRIKKLNYAIIIVTSISMIGIFIYAMFFGAATPDQSIVSVLVLGSPVILAPFTMKGVIDQPETSKFESRMTKGWLYANICLVTITAIFPSLTSMLPRLALYLISAAVLLATIAIYNIVKKIKRQKLQAIGLIGLLGVMGLTISYAYPDPQYNFGQQEVYWDAEFETIDYILYVKDVEFPILQFGHTVVIDTDFRLSAILQGYGGLNVTFELRGYSWLTPIVFMNESTLYTYVTNSTPSLLYEDIDFIEISRIMWDVGYITGWAVYGDDNDDWIVKFPDIIDILPLNPHISRVYDNKITFLLLPL
ncbi:MAG: glycosyltransferase family 39 protein [Candidatus Thorarchaeota archaeon]